MMVDDELLGIVKCFFGKPVLNQAVCLGTTDGFERCSRTIYIYIYRATFLGIVFWGHFF